MISDHHTTERGGPLMRPEVTSRQFARHEGGNMLVFGLCIFSAMLFASGMAIDLMRHETERTRLQSTLDRAVLAAADMEQTGDPVEVVRDYVSKSGLSDYNLSVSSETGLVHRSVEANAQSNR